MKIAYSALNNFYKMYQRLPNFIKMNIKKENMKKIIIVNGNTFTSGDEVILIIGYGLLIVGKIHVHNDMTFFICHNNKALTGSVSPETYGYTYSYLMRNDKSNQSMLFHNFDVKAKRTHSKDNIIDFLQQFGYRVVILFYFKIGITDLYDIISGSVEQGYVELHSRERSKKLSIRLGRLIKKMVTAFNKLVLTNPLNTVGLDINDELIEKIHNKWMAIHPGAITHKLISGEDILIGYTGKNYVKGGSSLQGSCMTNKLNYLKIYTENPDKVSMMIFYSADKVCGRTIIWKCDDGISYHDRIYIGFDWLHTKALNTLKEAGITPLKEENQISLSNIEFDNYPFMDHFYYADIDNKTLYYDPRNKKNAKYILRSTDGELQSNNAYNEELING